MFSRRYKVLQCTAVSCVRVSPKCSQQTSNSSPEKSDHPSPLSSLPCCKYRIILWTMLHRFRCISPPPPPPPPPPPCTAYMHRWSGSALVQIIAWRLDGTKPLSGPMLTYCQLEPQTYVIWNWNGFEYVVYEMAAIFVQGDGLNGSLGYKLVRRKFTIDTFSWIWSK